jgi:hypothetical protein
MKELVDMYSGPDVVSAKQQEEELQRVASTLPESIPNSVKRFTDKTLLSLKVCLLKFLLQLIIYIVFMGQFLIAIRVIELLVVMGAMRLLSNLMCSDITIKI